MALKISRRPDMKNIDSSKEKTAKYTEAEGQMKFGKRLVISGFILSIIGIIAYCVANFNMTLNQEYNGILVSHSPKLVIPTLGIIGIGVLVWLIGTFIGLCKKIKYTPQIDITRFIPAKAIVQIIIFCNSSDLSIIN